MVQNKNEESVKGAIKEPKKKKAGDHEKSSTVIKMKRRNRRQLTTYLQMIYRHKRNVML